MSPIPQNLIIVQEEIRRAELAYGRQTGSVSLLAVSKGQPLSALESAYAAGQTAFGENYLQEALPKIYSLAGKNIAWHFIGPIQSNKIGKIAENFQWVQSVSNIATAERLSQHRASDLPLLNICLQVNISGEPTKAGTQPENLLALAEACQQLPHLKLRGLMSIPAPTSEFAKQRATFQQLHHLFADLKAAGFELDTLSMGMSDDMVAAIAEGTTMVRIGTKIFGQRQ